MKFRFRNKIRKTLAIGLVLVCFYQLVQWKNENIAKQIASITAEISSADWAEITSIVGTDQLPLGLNIDYTLDNRTLCSMTGEILLIVIVHTAPRNFNKRNAIRQTWMHPKYHTHYGPIRLLFVLGGTEDKDLQISIEKESHLHGDILQGNFKDSYHNITNKAVMAFKWLTDQCKHAKFVLKVDDDVVVNIFYFFHTVLPFLYSKSNTVVCVRDTVAKIRRRQEDKWFVHPKYFPGHDRYPDSCMGYFVLLTGDLMLKLYEAAKVTPFFWIDDIYAYGILLNRIPKVDRISVRETESWFGVTQLGIVRQHVPKSCLLPLLRERRYCKTIIAIGDLSTKQIVEYWKIVLRYGTL